MRIDVHAQIVHIKATASQRLEKRHDPFAVAEGPEQGRGGAQVIDVRPASHQVAGNALQLAYQQADVLRPPGWLDAHQLLDCPGVGHLVEHGRKIVRIVHVADAAHDGPILQDLLDAAVQVADHRFAIDYRLPLEPQHQP